MLRDALEARPPEETARQAVVGAVDAFVEANPGALGVSSVVFSAPSLRARHIVEATRRWADDGIVANSLMPGGIMTNLQRHIPAETRARSAEVPSLKTPQQGASTSLVAAISPEFEGIGGRYVEDGTEAEVIDDDVEVDPTSNGVRRWALDPASAARLWDVSLDAVGDAGR
ncbi:hypothetical protein EV383_3864 [Pseudonocardia sediminis]|uniref:Short subunit dehydrogenase n=1 Tax=Pseudonocardia sediminis TaxID=1397368 RepID=A0A4Q7V300_PSEST|nr:hypothetical protein [Pseudonocardia sediminis]RZT86959.1 hypothetical protein EV383_3864 [Pseudonocardia sediminis]